jgi:hypothetical protein
LENINCSKRFFSAKFYSEILPFPGLDYQEEYQKTPFAELVFFCAKRELDTKGPKVKALDGS